jgi:hypothetical protein
MKTIQVQTEVELRDYLDVTVEISLNDILDNLEDGDMEAILEQALALKIETTTDVLLAQILKDVWANRINLLEHNLDELRKISKL